MVIDLIQPTVIKLNEDRENVGMIKSLAEFQKKRVDELETLVLKSGKNQTRFDEIFNRITEAVYTQPHEEQEKQREIGQLKLEESIKTLKGQIDMIDYKVEQKIQVAATLVYFFLRLYCVGGTE